MLSNNKLKIRKVELKDFPNYKKLLVIQNIPLDTSEDEIEQYFYTILVGNSKEGYQQHPISAVKRYEELGIATLEFRKKQDSDICLLLDDVKEFSSTLKVKMRIFRVKRFITYWNDIIEKGQNPMQSLISGSNSNFRDLYGTQTKEQSGFENDED